MGRKKKIVSEESFNDVFGEFNVKGVTNQGPFATITTVRSGNPCTRCGRYPRLHDMNFRDKAAHPKHFYVDCECGECDGEWYLTEEEAISAWNAAHQGGTPRDESVKDEVDFVRETLKDLKFED